MLITEIVYRALWLNIGFFRGHIDPLLSIMQQFSKKVHWENTQTCALDFHIHPQGIPLGMHFFKTAKQFKFQFGARRFGDIVGGGH